ncbi:hypothetical protein [Halostagnicola sp. A-GB9-2]|uniref:hypothetical protein n=1 Tax=Halostagnicola sp. A-GB9-2 TaxID=3048066 RepID=UPI0024C0B1A3|nr:hypothetical protein [Halostagnicola sp. A-GB9-2]MDJ1433825.1 hypothetical protein [Halostagnicola sp. A-GB9-2]
MLHVAAEPLTGWYHFEVISVSPGLGEHTRKVLAKFAYDEEEIDRLLDEGVV